MTMEPGFFKRLYLKHIPGQKMRIGLHFMFQLDPRKKRSQVSFESDSPIVAYHQH